MNRDLIKIGIIEDNIHLLENYREFFSHYQDIKICFAYRSLDELEQHNGSFEEPDLVLLDLILPLKDGIEGISLLRRAFPLVKILVISGDERQETVVEIIRKGAHGFLTKPGQLSEVYRAITDIYRDGAYLSSKAAARIIAHVGSRLEDQLARRLTKRELELVMLLKEGLTYKELAEKMFVSVYTVNHHLKKIYQKLNVESKSQLISKVLNKNF
ncbi:MAG TPA: response regulator transcription factor [Flavihumibacter sp.]|jgi:DNA-binding NarL/FixJ family response regulator